MLEDVIGDVRSHDGGDDLGGAFFGPDSGLDGVVLVVGLDFRVGTGFSIFGFSAMLVARARASASFLEARRTVSGVIRSVDFMVVRTLSPGSMSFRMPSPGC